jgi:hypothetical protein
MGVPNQGGPVLNKGQFRVSVNGFVVGYFTAAKIPTLKVKVTKVKQAGAAVERKYPSGLAECDDAELTYNQDTRGAMEAGARAWLVQCVEIRNGRTAVPPDGALRDVQIDQMNTDGTVVHTHVLHGCFPIETGDIELEGGNADAVDKKMKLSVTWPEQTR